LSGHDDRRSQFVQLFQRLCPVVLKLAVDVERVARQLFEPLVLQLVRLYSIYSAVRGTDTVFVRASPDVFPLLHLFTGRKTGNYGVAGRHRGCHVRR
jgi:hypothetical protein